MKRFVLPLIGLVGISFFVGCREPAVRTHAFSHSVQNYDPDIVGVKLEPAEMDASVGSERTLFATVIGKDGKPASGKRVEWMICRAPNAVGEIIAVDESGLFLADRGAKWDNDLAITYTNQFDHDLEKAKGGGPDIDTLMGKRGPNEILKGQTWITITAAAPGETHIMAYVPGIMNPTQSRAFAVVRWEKVAKPQ